MKKILFLLALAASTAFAQSYTTVTANRVVNAAGSVLSVGKLCFVPSVAITASGAGSSVTSVCGTIFNGALSASLQVPNLATASPSGATYTIQVVDTSSGVGSFVLWIPGISTVTGSSFSWDAFTVPPQVVALGSAAPLVPCQTGAVYVQSNASPAVSRWSCVNGLWQSSTGQTSGGGGGSPIPLPVSVANGGTGTSTPSLVAGANVSVTGSFPNQTISSSGDVATTKSNTWTSGTQDWSQVAVSKPVVSVSSTPVGSCANAAAFETNTNASVPNIYECISGSWQLVGGSNSNGITAIVGDVLASGVGTVTATLASVNANPGTFGSSVTIPVITADNAGRLTSISTANIPVSNYQTISVNNTPQTQRPVLNLAAGGNVTLTASDNGSDTTTVTVSSTGTGGGGGASLATQLLDFAPGTGTSTSIPFGGSCNSTTPCSVSIGTSRYAFNNPATLGLASGTASDVIYFYVDNTGQRSMGYSSANTYTCVGCEVSPVSGVSGFPAGSYPLYVCPVTAGVLSSTACVDKRPILAATPIQGSLGIGITQSNNISSVVLAEKVRAVTGTSDTLLGSDCGNSVTYNNPNPVSVTLPQAGLGGQFVTGCVIEVHNYGAGLATITPTGSSVGGTANLQVSSGAGQRLLSDGTNYQLGAGGGSGGVSFNGGTVTSPIVVNSTTMPAFTAQGAGSTGYNIYDLTSDDYHYQIGLGGSASSGSAEQTLYMYDKVASQFRFRLDHTGLISVVSGRFNVAATSSAPPCSATADIGNIWFNNTTSTTYLEYCVSVAGTIGWKQSYNSGNAPTITVGSSAGTGATASISGTSTHGTITLNTGTSTTGGGTVATVIFGAPTASAPSCIIGPASSIGATGVGDIYAGSASTSQFSILGTSFALTSSTTYLFTYICVQ